MEEQDGQVMSRINYVLTRMKNAATSGDQTTAKSVVRGIVLRKTRGERVPIFSKFIFYIFIFCKKSYKNCSSIIFNDLCTRRKTKQIRLVLIVQTDKVVLEQSTPLFGIATRNPSVLPRKEVVTCISTVYRTDIMNLNQTRNL